MNKVAFTSYRYETKSKNKASLFVKNLMIQIIFQRALIKF